MANEGLKFPQGFLWGVATSAHQTEGNNTHSDWWAWEQSARRMAKLRSRGLDPEKFRSGMACDFYRRFESDFDLAQRLNQNAFRLSLEWARIEPQPGQYDTREIEHYRQVLRALKKRNFKICLTLHHFTLPQWFAELGGFSRGRNVAHFLNFVRLAAREYGSLVDLWVTINEPEIYASHAYFLGRFPPQRRSYWLTYWTLNNLIAAHNQAYPIIKQYSPSPVSLAYHLVDLVPASIFSKFARDVAHFITNRYVLNRTWRNCDYIGVNYYGHSHIGVLGQRMHRMTHHEISDMGWGIHPEGIERVLRDLKKYGKPIYVTENGVADAADTKRWAFIHDHLLYIHKAMQAGANVRGYFYWSLIDNFEWAHGFQPRFGLAAVDYATQARTVRPSALSYAEVCKTNQLPL